jgi:hypothetical protein
MELHVQCYLPYLYILLVNEIDHKNDIVLHGWTFTTWINLILNNKIEHKGKPNTYVNKYDIYMVTKWWNFTT